MEPEVLSYSVSGACRALGCGRTKLYQLIAEGRLKPKKLGVKTLIRHSDLARLLDSLPDADFGNCAKVGASKAAPERASAP